MRIYSQRPTVVRSIKKKQIPQLADTGNSKTHQKALQEIKDLQDSSSDDSRSCMSDGSDLCRGVEELSYHLKTLAKLSKKETTPLEYDTISTFFRKAQDDHIPPPHHIQQKIDLKGRESPFNGYIRPNIDLNELLLHDGFDTFGLFPGIDLDKQLEILKIKERLLIIDRWEEVWNQVRPPKNAWYSLANKDFSDELARHNNLLRNQSLQNLEYQTRESLIEIYHNLSYSKRSIKNS